MALSPYESPGGIGDFHRLLQRQRERVPLPPRAVDSPPGAPINPGGLTKEDLASQFARTLGGGSPEPAPAPAPEMAPGPWPGVSGAFGRSGYEDPWSGVPYGTPPPDSSLSPAVSASPLRYSTPTSGGMQDYDPDKGIESFARVGGTVMGRPLPGPSDVGGAYSPSQLDWNKVANPEDFEAFRNRPTMAAMEAERVKAERTAADPLWEDREKSDIWVEAQLKLQEGIQQAVMGSFLRKAEEIEAAVRQEMRGASPDQIQTEVNRRLQNLEAYYASIFGERGGAGAVRSFPGYPKSTSP